MVLLFDYVLALTPGIYMYTIKLNIILELTHMNLQVSPSLPAFIHSVPFQPATDNRSNFSCDKAFHIFKKQR